MGHSLWRKLLRTKAKLSGKRSLSGVVDQGLDLALRSPLPHSPLLSSEEKEKSWLETAIVQSLNTFPRAWTQPIYFNSTEAFHGEKKKTYAWPNTWNTISISVASNIIPHNGTSSLCWGSATHSTLRHLLWNTRDYNKGKDYKWRDDEAGFYSSNIPW